MSHRPLGLDLKLPFYRPLKIRMNLLQDNATFQVSKIISYFYTYYYHLAGKARPIHIRACDIKPLLFYSSPSKLSQIKW